MNVEQNLESTLTSVGILLGSFSAGGSERAMINFANAFVKQGVDVDLMVGRAGGPFRDLVDPRIKVHDLKIGFFRGFPILRRYLQETQPDVLFSSQINANTFATLARIWNRTRTKLVLRESTTPSEHIKTDLSSRERICFWLARRFANFPDHYVAVSEDSRTDAINFYGLPSNKITTIYSSFVNDELWQKSKQTVEHKWFASNQRVIASMGRVMPVKDFETLVRAFAIVRQQVDAKLLILGDTDRDPVCFKAVNDLVEKLALQEHVDFVGFQANPFPYLASSEVYALSSRFEGMPGALVQAIALGCKPVSTDCRSGPREILAGGERGPLVKVGDPDDLARGILEALNRPHNRENGKHWTREFEEATAISKLTNLFEHLLIAGRSRQKGKLS